MTKLRRLVVSMFVLAATPAAGMPAFERPYANSGPAKSLDRDSAGLASVLERCAKGDAAFGQRLKDYAAKAAALQDPADRKTFGAYFAAMQQEYDAQQLGIPGHGTYAELAKRRDQDVAEVEAAFPTIEPKTPAEMTATREAYAKFRARAQQLRELGLKLDAASPCLRHAGDWHAIIHGLQPDFVQERIQKHATPILNALRGPFSTWSRDAEQLAVTGKHRPADADAMAKLVNSAVQKHAFLIEQKDAVAQLPGWADYAPAFGREWYRTAPQKRAELEQAMATIVDTYLGEVKPPAGPKDAASEKTFRAWYAGHHKGVKLLAVRIAEKGQRDRDTYDKQSGIKYREKYRFVKAYYVTAADATTAVPNVDNSALCELRWATIIFYEKGFKVQLRTWMADAPPMRMSPMLCKHAKATF